MSTFKRIMCMLLSLVMVLGMFPVSAFATMDGLEAAFVDPVVPELLPVMPEVPMVPEYIPEPLPELPIVPDVVPEIPIIPEVPVEPEVFPTEEPVISPEPTVAPTEEPVVTPEPTETPAPVAEAVAVYFNCSPAEASLFVYDAFGVPVMPSGIDGAYILMPGNYAYSAYCEGYVGVEAVPFTVVDGMGSMFIDVVLQAVIEEAVPETGDDMVVMGSVEASFYNSAATSGTFNGSSAQTDANGNLLINDVNFPDANFRQYISEQFDTNNLGYLSDAQVDSVISINCSYKSIANLKGIEYFTGLTWLNCSNNTLSSIDISKNTALKQFFCDSNQLTNLNVSANTALTDMQCINNKLTDIVLESNTALESLMCGQNNLSSLNVSANTLLCTLYCDNNNLTYIDLSKNTALYDLECHDNPLTSLDLSYNTALEYLDCANTSISTLDLTNNSALVNLNCENSEIKELNLSKNYKLEYLYCNDNNLPCLDLSSNQKMLGRNATIEPQTVQIDATLSDGNYVIDMATLVGSENISRVTITSGGEYENGIVTLTGVSADADTASVVYSYTTNGSPAAFSVTATVTLPEKSCEHSVVIDEAVAPTCTETGLTEGSHCELCGEVLVAQEEVSAKGHNYPESNCICSGCGETFFNGSPAQTDSNGNLLINEINFPDETFRNYISGKLDSAANGFLNQAQVKSLTEIIDMSAVHYTTSLKGVEYFTALKKLDCERAAITELDVSKNTALLTLKCGSTGITQLDIRNNTALNYLNAHSNKLTSIDLSNNTALTRLVIDSNLLETLDVSQNTLLDELCCSDNNLSSLDLSRNTNLVALTCYSNKIYTLDLSANTKLTVLMADTECTVKAIKDGAKLYVDFKEIVGADNLGRVSYVKEAGTDTSARYDSSTGLYLLDSSYEFYFGYYTKGSALNNPYIKITVTVEEPACSHIEEVDAAVAPTCTETGLTEGKHCSACDEVLVAQEIIPANGHKFVSGACSACGIKGGTCGDYLTWVLDDAGTLTISGSGAMKNYTMSSYTGEVSRPWSNYLSSITSLIVENGVTDIGDYAFYECSNLSTVALADSIVSVGDYSFTYCSALTDVIFPNNIVSIGRSAFSHCDSLTSVILPQTVTTVGTYAFAYNDGLTNAFIPHSVTSISSPFYGCSSAFMPTYDGTVKEWVALCIGAKAQCSDGSVLDSGTCGDNLYWMLDADGVLTIYGSGAMMDYTSSLGTASCADWLYSHLSSIFTVIIEDGVTHIGDYAFYKCSNLKNVRLTGSLPSFGSNCFYGVTATAYYTCGAEGWSDADFSKTGGTISLSPKHNSVIDEAVPPTCTETGLTEGSHCSGCGMVHVAQGTVPAAHTGIVTDEAVEPSCTETGLTEGSHCEDCGEVIVAQETVPTAHTGIVTDEAVEPSCTETGLTEGSHCEDCGEVIVAQETVPTAHTGIVTDEAVEPSCTETGLTEGSHCEDCGEVIVAQETVPTAHTGIVTDEAVEPTCTEDGLTEGSHCEDCGEVLVEQEVDPAAHKEVTDEAVEPTCVETGLTEGSHCKVCGEVFVEQEEIPTVDHTFEENHNYDDECTVCGLIKGTCGSDMTWTLDKDGNLVISGTGKMYPGGTIFYSCWYDYSFRIKSIVIEPGVTSIGSYAFYGLYNLTDICIPEGVTTIGEYAFYNCKSLTEIKLPNSLSTIGSNAFYYCQKLESISIGFGLTEIGYDAFSNCSNLSEVYISDIAAWCAIDFAAYGYSHPFSYSRNGMLYLNNELVTELVIPDGVTAISSSAFNYFDCISSVIIPASVSSIGKQSFSDCSGLKEIEFCHSADDAFTIGSHAFYVFETTDTVVKVADEAPNFAVIPAYDWADSNRNVSYKNTAGEVHFGPLDNGLNWILTADGKLSISGAGSMATLNRGEYPWSALSDKISSIEIGSHVTGIGSYAFANIPNLTGVVIPANVKSIGSYAFYDCTKLASISFMHLPTDALNIGFSAFGTSSYSTLKTTVHLNNVEGINPAISGYYWGSRAVTYENPNGNQLEGSCGNGVNFKLLGSGELVISGNGAMDDYSVASPAPWAALADKITTVTINGNLSHIGNHAFEGCEELTDIAIPGSVSSIGASAFSGCRSLAGIDLPDSLRSIGSNSFENCSSLKSIRIPEGVAVIGDYAFSGCSGLSEITLPSSLAAIGNYAFSGCSGLDEVSLPGCLASIGSHAFEGCSGLRGIVIPDSVTSMGDYAFSGCSGLSTVTLSNGLSSISPYAFSGCSSLSELVIPNGVTALGEGALSGCSGIKKLTVPASLVSIGKDALDNVSPSDGIIYDGTKEQWDSIEGNTIPSDSDDFVFTSHSSGACGTALKWSVNSAGVLFITGSGTMDDYSAENPAPWHEYVSGINTVNLPAGLTKIGANAFAGMAGVSSLNIPASVTAIGAGAFKDCSGLVEIHFASTTAPEIAEDAFVGCSMPNAFYPRGYEDWFKLSKNNPLREYACFMPEGCNDFGDCIKYVVEFYAGGEPETISISSTVTINGDLSIAENVTLVIGGGATLTVNGTVNVLGELSVGDGLESKGDLKARNIEISGAMYTEAMAHVEADSINVNAGGSLNCTVRGSVIDVAALTVSGKLLTYTGQINAAALTCTESAEIELAIGFTDTIDTLAQDPGLNVSGTVSIAPGKMISIIATDHKITSGTVSANLWPYVDFGGDVATDAEILASYLAYPFAKSAVIITGTVTLDRNTTISENTLVSVQAGTAENPGKLVVTPGCRLVNNGSMTVNGTIHVEDEGSFRNNAAVFVESGGTVNAANSYNIGHGGTGYLECDSLPESDKLQAYLNCGLKKLSFTKSTPRYYISNDIEIPEDVSFNINGGDVYVNVGAKLTVHNIIYVKGGILSIFGEYSGPDIYVYDYSYYYGGLPGGLVVAQYDVREINHGGVLKERQYTILNPKATSLGLVDMNGQTVKSSSTITHDMYEEHSYKLNVRVTPTKASSIVNWKSSNTNIATVSRSGLVTFHAPGTVTITATAKDGSGKSANVKFNVLYKGFDVSAKFTATLPAESTSFDQPMNIGLQLGDSVQPMFFGPDKTTALDPALFEYSVDTVSNGPFVSVDDSGLITAIKAGGTGIVTATFRGDPLKRSVKVSVKTINQMISKIAVLPYGMDNGDALPEGYVGVDANGDLCSESGLAPVSYAIMVDKGAARTFRVQPVAMNISGEKEADIIGRFNWASTGTDIATVKANADGSATVSIKASSTGACTITATSKDARKAVGSIAVYVMDYAPRLEAATATLDSQKVGSVSLPLVESYGNRIKSVEYYYTANGGKGISASYDNGVLTLKADGFIKNQTIKGTLYVSTEMDIYPLTLSINIKNTAPAVTVKQLTKFNLFYTDSMADMTVTVKNENVSKVELVKHSNFEGKWENNQLLISAHTPSAKPVTKATLKIHLDGYNAPVEKAVTIGTVTTKPALSFSPASGVINIGLGETTARTTLIDKSTGQLPLSSGYTVSGSSATAAVSVDGSSILVTGIPNASGKYSNSKVNISVQGINWISPITLGFSLSYNSTAPSLKLAKTLLSLNAAYTNAYDETQIVPSHANIKLSDLSSVSVYPVNYNAEMEKLNVHYENGMIKASVKSGATVKNGSYSYGFTASYGGTMLKEVRFTVKIASTPLTGKLSKTSITLNNIFTGQTAETQLLSTKAGQTVSNITISSAVAVGSAVWDEARHIQFSYDGDHITAKIKDGEYVKPGSYSFNVNASISDNSGVAAMKTLKLTVKVVNVQPKVTLSSNVITLNTLGDVPLFEKGHIALLCSTAGYTLTGCEYERTDTNSSTLAQSNLIEISRNGADIYANLDSSNMPKLGTYKFRVYPVVKDENGQSATLNPINFSVKVVNTKLNLSVSMSASGKLDATLRQTSKITYTVTKINGMAGKVFGVELLGDDAAMFNAALGAPNAKGQPTVILTLKDGVDYSTAKSYKIQFQFLLENSWLLFPSAVSSSVLTVKVSNSSPKLTANPNTLNIYQSQSRSRIVYYTVNLTGPAGAAIGSIRNGATGFLQQSLVNENTNVSYVITEDGRSAVIKVVIKDTSKLSPNKSYTLPLLIRAYGQAVNSADVKLNLSLKVLK